MINKQIIKNAVERMIADILNGNYHGSMTGLQKLSPMEVEHLRRNLYTRLGLKKGRQPVV